ncbi:MAG TPA: DUF4157 domain-containing protein [Bacillota bacterium]|nr:DUF4157 domain-containing protein [Bacillota bacterium]
MAESLKATAVKTEAKSEKPAIASRVGNTTLPDTPQLQLIQMQQTFGNRAVHRWLASSALQAEQVSHSSIISNQKVKTDPLLQTKNLLQLEANPAQISRSFPEESQVSTTPIKPTENEKTQRQADEDIQTQADEEIQTQGQDEELQKQSEEEEPIQGQDEELQKQGEEDEPVQGQDEELQKQDEEGIQTQGEEEVQAQTDEEVQTQNSAGSVQFAAKRTDPYASPEVLNTIRTQRGQGEPLEGGLQFQMERSLGADFGSVRVHRDATAARLNGMLSARAFTNRNDIYFNQGQYNPQSRSGQHLLAHELAHVVQQRNIPDLQFQLQDPGIRNQYEREANSAADQAVYGITTAPQGKMASLPSPTLKHPAGGSLQLAAENQGSETEEPLQFGFLDALTNPIEWAKEKVKPYLRQIPGYDLLTLIIGKDPLSGTPVERNGSAIVKAVVGLIPGGAAFLENLTKTGVIARAAEWFGEEFAKLNLGWETIKSIFSRAIDAAKDAIPNIPKAIENAKNVFMEPIKRIFNFIKTVGPKLMEFIFEGALALAGAPVQMIMGILNKGKEVLKQIITNPIGFLGNLVNAIKGGLGKFVGNIVAHLQSGLAGWLFGAIGNIGLVLPKKLDLAGIFHIIAQILGVTWRAIRT